MFLRLDAGLVGAFIAMQGHFKQFRNGQRRVFPAAGSVSPHRNLSLHPVPVWGQKRSPHGAEFGPYSNERRDVTRPALGTSQHEQRPHRSGAL